MRRREREMKKEGGGEGKKDTAWFHRYAVEWAVREVIQWKKK